MSPPSMPRSKLTALRPKAAPLESQCANGSTAGIMVRFVSPNLPNCEMPKLSIRHSGRIGARPTAFDCPAKITILY